MCQVTAHKTLISSLNPRPKKLFTVKKIETWKLSNLPQITAIVPPELGLEPCGLAHRSVHSEADVLPCWEGTESGFSSWGEREDTLTAD